MTPQRWQNLLLAVRKMPGVGPKMAERIALYFMRSDETANIVRAIEEAREHLHRCSLCGAYTEDEHYQSYLTE